MIMRVSSLILASTGYLVSFASGQAPESVEAEEGTPFSGGPGASTDVSKYAGTYRFTYRFNSTPGLPPTAQLSCGVSQPFTVTIPDDPSESIIEKDLSTLKSGRDPIYNTKEGQWTVVEHAKANGHDTIKMRIYQDDKNEIYACWGLTLVDKNLVIVVNPKNLTQCPTSYSAVYSICTPNKANILGECLSGVCNGEESKFSTKSDNSAARSDPVNLVPLLFILSSFFYNWD